MLDALPGGMLGAYAERSEASNAPENATYGRTDALTEIHSPDDESSTNASHAGGQKNFIPLDSPTWVYHCFCSHNAEIYVGVARDVTRRLREHRARSPWFGDVDAVIAFLYPTRQHALAIEAHGIRWGNESTLRNRRGFTDRPAAPGHEQWIRMRDYDNVNDGPITPTREYVHLDPSICEACGGSGWIETVDGPVLRCWHMRSVNA